MEILKVLNSALAFLLELSALIILGLWGYSLTNQKVMQIILAIALPLFLAFIWGIMAAPNSAQRLVGVSLLLFKIAVFSVVTFGLVKLGHEDYAMIFGVVGGIHLGFSYFADLL